MRIAADVATAAHDRVMVEARESDYEFQVEANFLDVHQLCGVKQQAYPPIVGRFATEKEKKMKK